MNAKYITPVIVSVQNVFETMIQLPVVSGKQFFKKEKRPTTDVICMITMVKLSDSHTLSITRKRLSRKLGILTAYVLGCFPSYGE